MFCDVSLFNSDVSKWDVSVSHVTNMRWIFFGASLFNSDVSKWDVSHVTNMGLMFDGTWLFNNGVSPHNFFTTGSLKAKPSSFQYRRSDG